MRGAHDVAALLISEQHSAGRTIDKMQLQKLLYLVQGANLAYWGEAAFRESLRAYANGPVVANVEATYRDAAPGRDPLAAPIGGQPERLDADVVESVRSVLRFFGEWTARNLERFVKRPDSPWREVRGDLPDGEPSNAEIPVDLVAAWFHEHGVAPNRVDSRRWEATPAERAVADERLRQAKAAGAFSAQITPEVERAAERSLAKLRNGSAGT